MRIPSDSIDRAINRWTSAGRQFNDRYYEVVEPLKMDYPAMCVAKKKRERERGNVRGKKMAQLESNFGENVRRSL